MSAGRASSFLVAALTLIVVGAALSEAQRPPRWLVFEHEAAAGALDAWVYNGRTRTSVKQPVVIPGGPTMPAGPRWRAVPLPDGTRWTDPLSLTLCWRGTRACAAPRPATATGAPLPIRGLRLRQG